MSNEIGKQIEKLMIKNGFNQKQLSKYADLTEAAISNYISGTRTPNKTSLAKIAKALNTTPEEISSDSKSYIGATAALTTLGAVLSSAAMLSPTSMITTITGAALGGTLLSSTKKNQKNSPNKVLLDYQKDLLRFQKISIAEIQSKLMHKKLEFSYKSIENNNDVNNPDYMIDINNDKIKSWWFVFWKESDSLSKHYKMSKTERAALLISKFVITKPDQSRKCSIVINDSDLFDAIFNFKGRISYKGNLSVILVDEKEIELLKEQNICFYDDNETNILTLI